MASLTALTTSAERERGRRVAGRRGVRTDRGLLVVAAVLVTWLVGYGIALGTTAPSGVAATVVQSLLYPVPIAAAGLLSCLAARRATGRDRAFWAAVAVYTGLWLAGEVVWSVRAVSGLPGGGGWPANALYLASYLPALAAALLISGRPSLPHGLRGLFDSVVIGLAVAYLGYQFTIVPALAEGASPRVLVDATYPVFDSVVLVAALSGGLGARRFLPLPRLLVTASFGCALVLDAMYSHVVDLQGGDGHWLDLGWQVEAVLICAAAVVAMRHPETDGQVRTLPSRWSTIVVLAACLDVLSIVGTRGLQGRLPVTEVVAGAAAVLVLVTRGVIANSELRRTAARLEEARAEQERLAVTDGLTGLYNRRFFEEFLSLEADRSLRQGSPLSLIVADLDHFKSVNDQNGHAAGDAVLVETARRLRTAVRGSDVLARYGGEEFVVVLPDTDPERALEIAERCRRVLHDSPFGSAHRRPREHADTVVMTGSFGVATLWSLGDAAVDDLVRAADRALYRAKTAGRNRVCPAGEWDFLGVPADGGGPSGTDLAAGSDPVAVALLRAAELVDADQGPDEHGAAIARWSTLIAARLGLDGPTVQRCAPAARLHDVGKLAIPRSVLTKPGRLDEHEWALMRTHPGHGESLLLLSPSVTRLAPIVRAHHERFDGTGYPDGLSGQAIPIEARIISVCDAWAAMRSDRAYASKRPPADCRRELVDGRGSQFDPAVVDAFLALEAAGQVGDPGAVRGPTPRPAATV